MINRCLIKIAPPFFALFLIYTTVYAQEQKRGTINRQVVVGRHNLTITNKNELGPSQVGNGNFAYGFDITGLQTLSDKFTTMSHWGWHTTPSPNGLGPKDFIRPKVNTHGKLVDYDLPNPDQPELTKWLQSNVHRLNLGRIGLWIKKADGTEAKTADIQNAIQHVDLWTGIAESIFIIEGTPVKVTTVGDANNDVVGFKIESVLFARGQLGVFIEFPYGNINNFSNGADYKSPSLHQTVFTQINNNSALFNRTLDTNTYQVKCNWTGVAKIERQKEHRYTLIPAGKQNVLECVFYFSPSRIIKPMPVFAQVKASSIVGWAAFWKSGGIIDLSQSKDPRWVELERRIVLSQYVMKLNAAGNYPPQETGLVSNSWYGKFHYEMYWWHAAHYALWNRWPILNKSLHVYQDKLQSAIQRAKNQGYLGARFPKCTGPDGREWPSLDHAFLIWQQPHPIFFADLDYRAHPTLATLKKWDAVVTNSADFLSSYAFFDNARGQYILGPPMRVVSENNDAYTTINPTFELSYWRYGLATAKRLHSKSSSIKKPLWDEVLSQLAPLPVKDGLYQQWEGIENMWSKYNYEHPGLTGAFGMLPGNGVDTAVMENSFQKVKEVWRFDTGWGWDFPMVAMNAARLGHPNYAVNMLLHPSKKNGYDLHGYVGGGNPYPYFPANGGLLYAVAMMTAGWDGAKQTEPGWPKDGNWVVKWEDLKKAP